MIVLKNDGDRYESAIIYKHVKTENVSFLEFWA